MQEDSSQALQMTDRQALAEMHFVSITCLERKTIVPVTSPVITFTGRSVPFFVRVIKLVLICNILSPSKAVQIVSPFVN